MAKRPTASLTTPKGFYAAGGTCGIKVSGHPDLALIVADRPCAAAGVFTRSRTPGAPLIVSKRHLRDGEAAAIVVNSGNANASTGKPGEQDAARMCRLVAENLPHSNVPASRKLALRPTQVLVGSTGIIGRPLPMPLIERGIATLVGRLSRGVAADTETARAIMTTDLAPKSALRKLRIGRRTVHIAGIAKGSGMIAPNMGTMLAFLTTDAAVSAPMLQSMLRDAAAASFNRISVDEHTSPSDMALLLASGAAGHDPITRNGADATTFREALTELCRDLAYQIVKDGEGATKVFRVRVAGARSESEGDRVARAVVNSPLVKTAVHGGDPNWGRIVTAAGYSGAAVQPAKLALRIGADATDDTKAVCVYEHGTPKELNRTEQRRLAAIMKKPEITFTLTLGRGRAQVEWLGCDLSREYITINADYTT